LVELARAVKRCVGVPVIAVGRIEPEVGDALIGDGGADFIAMARKLLADPELPRKLSEKRAQDVRPCIYCYTCVGNIFLNGPTCCAVNPASGREGEFPLSAAPVPKRVLVAGGGPAGMEAARIAALRGHEVTLCERSSRLGGTLRVAALVAEENGALARWLETQVRALPIAVHLDCEVTPDRVAEWAPDVVLVATGARRAPPEIAGADRPDVWNGDDIQAALEGDRAGGPGVPAAMRVTVVGGGAIGVKFADLFSAEGRSVTILESEATLAAQMAPPLRWRTLHRLRERGVVMWSGVDVASVDDRGVHFVDAEGAAHGVPTDLAILAGGACGDDPLAAACAGGAWEVRAIGDCTGMGFIRGAMEDAGRAAREI
jgi:2,4-dienoyl-CoA reductase (NADPH2)